MDNLPTNNDDVDKGPWLSGKKRPNKGRSHTHGRSIHPNEHTGIRKPIIPQKYAAIIEDEDEEIDEITDASEIRGTVGTGFQEYRMVSKSRITPWQKVYVGPPNKSLPYRRKQSHSIRPSHPRPLGRGGRRSTHKHKRKNKHTRRRVQRRRA